MRTNGELGAALRAAAQTNSDECVILDGLRYRWGTGLVGGRKMNAARAVWLLAHGDPGTAFVLHTCHRGDVGCINIRHLYLGDQARNMRDMAEAGRGSKASRGELSPRAKLTRDDVRAIRKRFAKHAVYPNPCSSRALAEEFGITAGYVSHIASSRRWAWLDTDEAVHGQT